MLPDAGRSFDVLVVEADVRLSRLVRRELERERMAVSEVRTVAAALEGVQSRHLDAVLLDLMPPGGAGLEVLRVLRAARSVAHVIVMGAATSEAVRVGAFALGADDYVAKPFFVRELVGRVVAVRRRREARELGPLVAGHLIIDATARTVMDGTELLSLTAKEFDLLKFLATQPGRVFSHEDLLQAVWHSSAAFQQVSTVTEHVRRLRAKIESDPRNPKLVVTVHSKGYRLVPPGVATASDAA